MYLMGLWTNKGDQTRRQFIIEADSWDVARKLQDMYISEGFILQQVAQMDVGIVKGDLNGPAFVIFWDDGTNKGQEYIFTVEFKLAYQFATEKYGKSLRGITQTNFDFKDERPQ